MEETTRKIVRVALIGPESTAKSTLSDDLAKHYNTVYVKEYSRTYLKNIGRRYTLEDVIAIAKEQQRQENAMLSQANKILFADTELIVSKVWCEDVFKTTPQWIKENIIRYKYDLYLLTYHDLPWEADPVRENGHRRPFFFDWYERELKAIGANYEIIRGNGAYRFRNAIEAIERANLPIEDEQIHRNARKAYRIFRILARIFGA